MLKFISLVLLLTLETYLVSCDSLILTPYIKANKSDQAKTLSYVKNLPNATKFDSYSGYFTVNEKYNSNIFFWFFPSFKNPKTAPIIVYLEGGPGVSSLFSLFTFGPLKVEPNMSVSNNPLSWTQEFSMVYIDNPVGTGFSFTDKKEGLSTNENTIADNIYEVLQQFFTVFHEYRNNELYIAGQSYGGKFVPSVGYKLMKMSNTSNLNFKGIAIGNGWIDPIHQLDYSTSFHSLGLIDFKQMKEMQTIEENVKKQIEAKNYLKAMDYYQQLLFGSNITSYFTNTTGYTNTYYLLMSNSVDKLYDMRYFPVYLNDNKTQSALHVSQIHYEPGNNTVGSLLRGDFMQSVETNLTELIGKHKVLLFNGNLDIACSVTSLNGIFENKEWKYFSEYYQAQRTVWKVSKNDTEIAGYVKSFGKFYHVTVRNAAHCSICSQPRATLDMIKRFIYSKSFEN